MKALRFGAVADMMLTFAAKHAGRRFPSASNARVFAVANMLERDGRRQQLENRATAKRARKNAARLVSWTGERAA